MRRPAALLLGAVVCVAACTTEKLGTGARCERNSECAAPLVCRLDRCRRECNTTRDCAAGLTCVLDALGIGACQVPEDKRCTRPSDCADPLVCRFAQCVNQCNEDRDCPAGSVCLTDTGGEKACIDPSSRPCVRHEECASSGDVCALDGRCRYECNNDRDCQFGTKCCDTSDRACHEQSFDCGSAAPRDMGPPDTGTPVPDGGAPDGGPPTGVGLPNEPIRELSCHGDTTCVVSETSGLQCWGRNDHGQLARGTTSAGEPVPGPTMLMEGAPSIACDTDACCAQVGTGVFPDPPEFTTYCWGRFPDFDTGAVTDHLAPVEVPGLTTRRARVAVSAGTFAVSTFPQMTDPPGTVYGDWLWGDNTYGQLGDGTTTASSMPVMVDLGVPASQGGGHIRLGEGFGCAGYVTSVSPFMAGIRCWGRNDDGQLARGTTTPMEAAAAAAMIPPTASLVRLGRAHGCVTVVGGAPPYGVRCWGRGDEGQIGDGAGVDQPVPVEVIGSDVSYYELDCAGDACCVVVGTGSATEALCWGQGPGIASNVPAPVGSVPDPAMVGRRDVCLGRNHGCIYVEERISSLSVVPHLYCWGDNTYGQLGTGTLGGSSATPVEVMRAP